MPLTFVSPGNFGVQKPNDTGSKSTHVFGYLVGCHHVTDLSAAANMVEDFNDDIFDGPPGQLPDWITNYIPAEDEYHCEVAGSGGMYLWRDHFNVG